MSKVSYKRAFVSHRNHIRNLNLFHWIRIWWQPAIFQNEISREFSFSHFSDCINLIAFIFILSIIKTSYICITLETRYILRCIFYENDFTNKTIYIIEYVICIYAIECIFYINKFILNTTEKYKSIYDSNFCEIDIFSLHIFCELKHFQY